MRRFLAALAAAVVAAAVAGSAQARVEVHLLQPGQCQFGLIVDGTIYLLDGEFGVFSENSDDQQLQAFICHGRTPEGLVTETISNHSMVPGGLIANITVTPTVWTFTIVSPH